MSERSEKTKMYADLMTQSASRELVSQGDVVNMRLRIKELESELESVKSAGEDCVELIGTLYVERDRLREALKDLIIRFTGMFDGYVRKTYHPSSSPDSDLDIALFDARAALSGDTKPSVDPRDALIKAVEDIMIGGNHLASYLIGKMGGKMPNDFNDWNEVRINFGMDVSDVWICWKSIMNTRESLVLAKRSAQVDGGKR